LLALAALLCGCWERPRRPTVVLVTLDTTRADHLSTYGYARDTDPFLRSLAARSRVFEIAVPSATWTLPSHVSMFSGLDPAEHGCWRKLEESDPARGSLPGLSPATPLVSSALRGAGYHLVGAVGNRFTSRRFGLLRDFHDVLEPDDSGELSSRALNDWIAAALARCPADRPLFLFVNYFDAHAPYDAPKDRSYPFPEDGRDLPPVPPFEDLLRRAVPITAELLQDAVDQYDREIRVQDQALAELWGMLESHGLLEDTLVIVTADHGEAFGDLPELYGHGCAPFEPVAHVPLVVHRNGGPIDRVGVPVSVAHVARTILDQAGIPAALSGSAAETIDLLRLPEQVAPPFVEYRGRGGWLGVLRARGYKLTSVLESEAGRARVRSSYLMDLTANPTETPRRATGPEAAAIEETLRRELARRLARWQPEPSDLTEVPLREREIDALRGLGYVGDR
jgi:arylsulfatase A-like enzyme